MILVAAAVLLATAAGIAYEHRSPRRAAAAAGRALRSMLYGFVPFVSYVSFAHLHLSLGAGAGIAIAYLGLGLAGLLAWRLGRAAGMARPSLGGLICAVILVNTGYLGLPMTQALLGAGALSHAVAFDQAVTGPMTFTAGFAVGAAFGDHQAESFTARLRTFLTRNPPLAGAVAGLVVPRWLAPHPLVVASHVVVDALLVVGFFAVGVYLASERREDDAPLLERPDRRVGIALALRFLVNPAVLACAALAGLGVPGSFLLQAAMPSGINSLIVGHAYGLDQRLIATIIVWSTLLVLAAGTVAYLV